MPANKSSTCPPFPPLPPLPKRAYFGGISGPRPSRFQEMMDLEAQKPIDLNATACPENYPGDLVTADEKLQTKGKNNEKKVLKYVLILAIVGPIALVIGLFASHTIPQSRAPAGTVWRDDTHPVEFTFDPPAVKEDVLAAETGSLQSRDSEVDSDLTAWFNLPENQVSEDNRVIRVD